VRLPSPLVVSQAVREKAPPGALVPELVRDTLLVQRAAGVAFAAAWPRAIDEAAGQDAEASEWLTVLDATREAWAAAYDGREAGRAERALLAVAVDPDREGIIEPAVDPKCCRQCAGPIPPERLVHAKPRRPVLYCSARCRRDASVARLAA